MLDATTDGRDLPPFRGHGERQTERDLVLWLQRVHPAIAKAVTAAIVETTRHPPRRYQPTRRAGLQREAPCKAAGAGGVSHLLATLVCLT